APGQAAEVVWLERDAATACMRDADSAPEKIKGGAADGSKAVRFPVFRRRARNERGIGRVETARDGWCRSRGGHGDACTCSGRGGFLTLDTERFDLVRLLERDFAPLHRTQHPVGMSVALPQADDLLIGPVEENGN